VKSINLNEALKLWQMRAPLEDENHLSEIALEAVAKGQGDDAVFNHLSLCNWCRQRMWELQESRKSVCEADDYVVLLAANTGIPETATWVTADKKYKIEFNRMVSDPTKGVIALYVQPPFNFAGQRICVKDASGRELLCGEISEEGELTDILDDIDNLDLRKITISKA
jgi:hypothetical protein